MAVVDGLTKARMLAIEAGSIVDARLDGYDLVLIQHDGTEINVGYIRGEAATALLGIADSATIDLGLTGAGTPASPWALTADLKAIPAAYLDSSTAAQQQITTDLTVKAYLDPSYRGWGPAKVRLVSGGALSSTAYEWETNYVQNGSRVVTLRRYGTGWRILGQDDGGRMTLTLNTAGGWRYYGDTTVSVPFEVPRVNKLASGIVVLGGLARKSSAISTDEVIGYLPVGCRPDYDLIFGVNNNDNAKYIKIKTNGEIQAGSGWATGYVSLENIAFPAAGVASWTFIETAGTAGATSVFVNGWSEYNTAAYGRARWWKDPWGFVWTQGMIKGGTTTHNTQMFQMPTSCASYKTQHFATSATNAMGLIGTGTNDPALRYRNGSAGATWVSITGPAIVTTEAWNNNPWLSWTSSSFFGNGWVGFQNGTEYIGGLAELRREDGLAMFFGMMANGTVPSTVRYTIDELMPNRNRIFHTAAGDGRGRMDVQSGYDPANPSSQGRIYANQGSNAWQAYDSLKYIP